MSFDVSDKGFTAPTARQIINELRGRISDALGFAPDFSRDTFYGAWAASVGSILGDMAEGVQLIYDQRSIQNATGAQLDDLCALVGVFRRDATPSVIDLDLNGVDTTFVPAGVIVEDENGERWVSQEDATLDATAVRFEAITPGPITGSSFIIRTPVDGWSEVTNPTNLVLGDARETDTELLRRRAVSLQIGTTGSVEGIYANVDALDFIRNALVFDNPSPNTATVEGVSMPPHSVAVVVSPSGLVAEDRATLAQAILASKPAGIATVGSETETVVTSLGIGVDVNFDYATPVSVNVVVTYTISTTADITTTEVEEQMTSAIDDYFAALEVGEDVIYHRLYGAIASIEASDLLDGFGLTLDGSSTNYDTGLGEIATPNTSVTAI